MKKWALRIVGLVLLLIIAAGIYAFVSLNSIVKQQVETVAPQMTKTKVTLGSAKISPFSGHGELSDLVIGNPEGYKTPSALKFGEIKVDLKLSSLLSDVMEINQVTIQAPEITFENKLIENNLKQILDNINSTPPSGSKKKFLVKDVLVQNGKINWSVLGKNGTVALPEIHLQNIGTAENGVSASELARQILRPILVSVTKQAAEEILQGGEGLKTMGQDSLDKLNQTTKDLKNIFKK